MIDISDIRKDYSLGILDEISIPKDPFVLFRSWFKYALENQQSDPTAMTLATVSGSGKPSARIVLLKAFDNTSFIFFTNYQSSKGQHIKFNPHVALLFYWASLERQVRIEGIIEKISAEQSSAYFDKRPLDSRIGAIASAQSKIIESRLVLEKQVNILKQRYKTESPICPPNWGGYAVKATYFEFWQGRKNRLHDRICFKKSRQNETKKWAINRLAP